MKALSLLLLLIASVPSPAAVSAEALPVNFHVVDETVVRGGTLNVESAAWLKARGVQTILKLDGKNPAEITYGLPVHQHYINGLGLNLTWPLVQEILSDLEASRGHGPVYVHCEKGADRTGLIIALYRVAHGWSPAAAAAEMNAPEFGHSRLQVWIDFKFWQYSRLVAKGAGFAATPAYFFPRQLGPEFVPGS